MKVMLIIPPGFRYNTPPLGLLYVAAYLEKKNIPVSILDAGLEDIHIEKCLKVIKDTHPQVIGLSATTPEYPEIEKFATVLKKIFPEIILVIGGPHATLEAQNIIKKNIFDFAVIGEGEITFFQLCNAILNNEKDFRKIDGIAFLEKGEVVITKARRMEPSLDVFPPPARHMIKHNKYRNYGRLYERKPVAVMISSRGCPFQCIFCSHAIFGRKYRFLSPEKMVEEIKYLQQKYGTREIFFREDNFTADRKRVEKFCNLLLKENIDISWMCLADAKSINYKVARIMREAGCWYVAIGVESGNQEIQKILKKNLNLEKVKETFDEIQDAGLKTLAFFMIGNLVDTRETVNETIKYAISLNTDLATFTITTPFPNTELYKLATEKNLILDRDPSKISNNPSLIKQKDAILKTETLSPKELRRLQLKAFFSFYLRPKQLWRIFKDKRLRKIFYNIEPGNYSLNQKRLKETENLYERLKSNLV